MNDDTQACQACQVCQAYQAYAHVLEGEIESLRTKIVDLQHLVGELGDHIREVTQDYLWNCFVCDRHMIVTYGDSTWYECPNCEEPIHICKDCEPADPMLIPSHAYDCSNMDSEE